MTEKKHIRKLSAEILFLLGVSLVIAVFFLFFLRTVSTSIVISYCETKDILLTQLQEAHLENGIKNVSLVLSVALFVILFLFLLGQKLAYLQVIMGGIEALRIHRMDFVIPLEGENELTELAERINFLSETERNLSEKERELQKEREQLIRALSHDIRTPLTSIRSYSEYMAGKEQYKEDEVKEYITLIQRKAEQMKELTDQLLENSRHNPAWIEDGRLLMEQLAMEWEEGLEEDFICKMDLTDCPVFSGEIDIREFQRIFDNLYSNVQKYADAAYPVELKVTKTEDRLFIAQSNRKRKTDEGMESHGIGLMSIKSIAVHYGGSVRVSETEEQFSIQIALLKIS